MADGKVVFHEDGTRSKMSKMDVEQGTKAPRPTKPSTASKSSTAKTPTKGKALAIDKLRQSAGVNKKEEKKSTPPVKEEKKSTPTVVEEKKKPIPAPAPVIVEEKKEIEEPAMDLAHVSETPKLVEEVQDEKREEKKEKGNTEVKLDLTSVSSSNTSNTSNVEVKEKVVKKVAISNLTTPTVAPEAPVTPVTPVSEEVPKEVTKEVEPFVFNTLEDFLNHSGITIEEFKQFSITVVREKNRCANIWQSAVFEKLRAYSCIITSKYPKDVVVTIGWDENLTACRVTKNGELIDCSSLLKSVGNCAFIYDFPVALVEERHRKAKVL